MVPSARRAFPRKLCLLQRRHDSALQRVCQQTTVATIDMGGGKVEIDVSLCHSLGISVADNIGMIYAGQHQCRPKFALVLSCFYPNTPDVQTQALRTLATLHNHTTLITFFDAQLQRCERFKRRVSMLHLQ